jgi:hypothetical protein
VVRIETFSDAHLDEVVALCDLLSETDSVSFYEAFPHKTKPGYRLYDNT